MTTGYLAFVDQPSAQARSHTEAQTRGCKVRDVTQFWWEVREHPTVPGTFLLLLDDVRSDFAKTKLPVVERLQVLADQIVLSALDNPVSVIGTVVL